MKRITIVILLVVVVVCWLYVYRYQADRWIPERIHDATAIISSKNDVFYSVVINQETKNSGLLGGGRAYITHLNRDTQSKKIIHSSPYALFVENKTRDYLIFYENEYYGYDWWQLPLPNYYVLNLKTWSITSLGQVKRVSIGWFRNRVYYRTVTEQTIPCDTNKVGCYGSRIKYKLSEKFNKELE